MNQNPDNSESDIPDFLPPESGSWRNLSSDRNPDAPPNTGPGAGYDGISGTAYPPQGNTFASGNNSGWQQSNFSNPGSQQASSQSASHWFNRPQTSHSGSAASAVAERPWVTYTIIVICVLVWLAQVGSYGLTSDLSLRTDITYLEPWRLITSGFAHSRFDFTHILFNMVAVWLIGRMLEPILGHLKFAAVYLICMLGGDLAFIVLGPLGASAVGASGAIFGLLGVITVLYLAFKQPMGSVIALLAINVIYSLIFPGVAWQAHFGGFITGLILGALELLAAKWTKKTNSALSWIFAGIVTVLLLAGIYLYYAAILF